MALRRQKRAQIFREKKNVLQIFDDEQLIKRAHRITRSVVERGIGQWKHRFHILLSEIRYAPERACRIIMTCAILHNICKRRNIPPPPENEENVEAGDASSPSNISPCDRAAFILVLAGHLGAGPLLGCHPLLGCNPLRDIPHLTCLGEHPKRGWHTESLSLDWPAHVNPVRLHCS
ncbi:hypothetical protein QQF64_012120 [Cirrhinus molitorella]|uniref:DDE Tnp4 domain-containing protein n=1 Tax=Cirrhinus molitorella TaxID=172907 RepID=A0ABR3LVQ4_9TELE